MRVVLELLLQSDFKNLSGGCDVMCEVFLPDQVSDSSIKLQEEDLPAQLQQSTHTLWVPGTGQTVDHRLDLQQLFACNNQTGENTQCNKYCILPGQTFQCCLFLQLNIYTYI